MRYRLVGFDRKTDEMVSSDAVPSELIGEMRQIAGIPASDDGTGDYPLDCSQSSRIAQRLGIAARTDAVEYFIEPYLDEKPAVPSTPN
jgi:hypothetical protein